jgi:FtsZ-binding cell division protein ZapB
MDEIKKGVVAKKPAGGKSLPVGLIAIAVILAGVLIYMVIAYQGKKKEMFEMETLLTSEKDSLANELRLMIHGYDTLKTNNDTLNAQLEKEQDRIKKLLAINANNVQLIRTYRAEIGTMRNIMKSYIVQIDSLNTRNKILIAENEQIRGEISQVTRTNVELSKAREDLTAKVEIASVVQAKDIIVLGLNQKRKDTDRLDRMSTLSVCFTLRENPIAAAGRKTVYMRIIRPDGLVITDSPDNIFTYKDENLVFSASRDVDYENIDLEVCIYQPKSVDFIPGTATVELYLEGNLIGTATFALRK